MHVYIMNRISWTNISKVSSWYLYKSTPTYMAKSIAQFRLKVNTYYLETSNYIFSIAADSMVIYFMMGFKYTKSKNKECLWSTYVQGKTQMQAQSCIDTHAHNLPCSLRWSKSTLAQTPKLYMSREWPCPGVTLTFPSWINHLDLAYI